MMSNMASIVEETPIRIVDQPLTAQQVIALGVQKHGREKVEFMKKFPQVKIHSKEFLEEWAKVEHLYCQGVGFTQVENGHKFSEMIEEDGGLHKIYLIKNVEGTGDTTSLTFRSLHDLLANDSGLYEVITNGRENELKTPCSVLAEILSGKKGDASDNILSFEISKHNVLKNHVSAPSWCLDHSFVYQRRVSLEEKLLKLEEKLQGSTEGKEKKTIMKKAGELKKKIEDHPDYEKYIIITKAGAVTDVHTDPSAAPVFFHVLQGKKVFYLAEPTDENMALHKRHLLFEEEDKYWMAHKLADKWTRVEINTGEMAVVPAGWIHFVYTAEDTLAISGSFPTLQYDVEMQCKATRMDREHVAMEVVSHSHTFENFEDDAFAYCKDCIIPKLKEAKGNGSLEEALDTMNVRQIISQLGHNVHIELKNKKTSEDLYAYKYVFNPMEKRAIIKAMKKFLPVGEKIAKAVDKDLLSVEFGEEINENCRLLDALTSSGYQDPEEDEALQNDAAPLVDETGNAEIPEVEEEEEDVSPEEEDVPPVSGNRKRKSTKISTDPIKKPKNRPDY